MIALPMHSPRPHIEHNNTETLSPITDDLQSVSATLTQAAQTPVVMSASVLSPTRVVPSRRPKLSLETSKISLPFANKSAIGIVLSATVDSPTLYNTHANAFDGQPPWHLHSCRQPVSALECTNTVNASTPSASLSATFSSSSEASLTSMPYSIPICVHSILRNSPLPRRTVSATSTRPSKRMFPLVKRVTFHEKLVELIPALALEEPDASDSASSTSSIKRARVSESGGYQAQKEDSDEDRVVPSTPVQGWRKKRRRWVWTLGKTENKRTILGAEDESRGHVKGECTLDLDDLGTHT